MLSIQIGNDGDIYILYINSSTDVSFLNTIFIFNNVNGSYKFNNGLFA